jgi:hypothetical protein
MVWELLLFWIIALIFALRAGLAETMDVTGRIMTCRRRKILSELLQSAQTL